MLQFDAGQLEQHGAAGGGVLGQPVCEGFRRVLTKRFLKAVADAVDLPGQRQRIDRALAFPTHDATSRCQALRINPSLRSTVASERPSCAAISAFE